MSQERVLHAVEQAWRLKLTLSTSTLAVPAVQWAVFSEDPKARFATDLEMVASRHQSRLDQTEDAEARMAVRARQLAATWDRQFRLIGGDRVYLLTPGSGVCTVTSNEPRGPKWAATKAFLSGSIAQCWCVPFEAMPGLEAAVVSFGDENVLDLALLADNRAGV